MSETLQQVSSIIAEDDGASYQEIADRMGISESTARDHVRSLIDNGESIASMPGENGKKQFFYRSDLGVHPSNNHESNHEATRNKRLKTNEIRDHLHGMERRLQGLLNNSEPAVADGRGDIEYEQDAVIHRSDAHFGDRHTNEYGEVAYSPEITEQREREVLEKSVNEILRQQELGIKFDTIHLLLGGDMVTNEHTYANQQSHIVEDVDEQLDHAFEVYMDYIKRLTSLFPRVQVVCQSGNHGVIDPSYSNGANFDRFLYMMLDKAVRMSDMDNVTFIQNESSVFTNFRVRWNPDEDQEKADALGLDSVRDLAEQHRTGHKFHLRHGDNSLEHIGTSAGKRRWYNWLEKHEFDQAYRGHYHQHQVDSIHGDVRCIMTGSPKPPAEFEEKIAEWSTPSAYVHGVSDDETRTWTRAITFSE